MINQEIKEDTDKEDKMNRTVIALGVTNAVVIGVVIMGIFVILVTCLCGCGCYIRFIYKINLNQQD